MDRSFRQGGCRFIHGDVHGPDWRLCPADALPGGAWCAEHRAVVFRPAGMDGEPEEAPPPPPKPAAATQAGRRSPPRRVHPLAAFIPSPQPVDAEAEAIITRMAGEGCA